MVRASSSSARSIDGSRGDSQLGGGAWSNTGLCERYRRGGEVGMIRLDVPGYSGKGSLEATD